MAWDGIIWVKLNRPLTEEEKARQLKVDVAASDNAKDDFSVFSMNDVFLESSNVEFRQRGMLTYGCLFIVAMAVMMAWAALYALTHIPDNVASRGELTFGLIFMGGFFVFALFIGFIALWGLHQENFTWTRRPVRFNRRARMVYAFRGAGAKGVIAVPWDMAFFFVEPRKKDPISQTSSFNIRCHVLDDNRNVVQSFSVGSRVTTLSAESTEHGGKIVSGLSDQFEYIRRYMDRGPKALSYPELVPTEVSLANSMKIWARSGKRMLAERNAFVSLLVLLFSPFAFVTALLHYIGQRTSRQPVWPDDVLQDCEQAAVDEPLKA